MLGDVLAGSGTIAHNAHFTLTPPPGERWAIGVFRHQVEGNSSYSMYAAFGVAASNVIGGRIGQTSGTNNVYGLQNLHPWFIDNTKYLSVLQQGGGATVGFVYNGMKLN